MRGEEADTAHNDATWLLEFYDTFKNFTSNDVTDEALDSLAKVRGQFGELPHGLLAGHCLWMPAVTCRPSTQRNVSYSCSAAVQLLYVNALLIKTVVIQSSDDP